MNKKKTSAVEDAARFSKSQLLRSSVFSNRRDALQVLLDDGETYTKTEVENILTDFFE
jgi:hypothetical protein